MSLTAARSLSMVVESFATEENVTRSVRFPSYGLRRRRCRGRLAKLAEIRGWSAFSTPTTAVLSDGVT